MTPGLDEARAIFDEEHPGCDWDLWCRVFGIAPNVFVNRDGLCLFAEPILRSDCNEWAWFVWYASGPVAELLKLAPPLPWVCWQRHKTKRLHFTRWDRIRSLTMKGAH